MKYTMQYGVNLTSGETLCVPYLSSQYIVLILYSCCMLSTWKISQEVVNNFHGNPSFVTKADKRKLGNSYFSLTGQRSWLISSSVFFGFWWITCNKNMHENCIFGWFGYFSCCNIHFLYHILYGIISYLIVQLLLPAIT